MSKPENPLAFPRPASEGHDSDDGSRAGYGEQSGMSLLDYFAGQALNAYLCSEHHDASDGERVSAMMYKIAESMLIERGNRLKAGQI